MAAAILFFGAHSAKAVPAFAEQTGLACQACHVGGFGPLLTPLGRDFKLNGYTMRSKGFNNPLSAMAVASYTHTNKDQVPPPDGASHVNDNISLDQASLFVAGGIGQHFGGFAQITYDGVGKSWSWDNLDLRAVTKGHVFGQDAVFGLTLNNSPTVQDAWNTTPAWGFPYTSTAVSGTPGAAPLIDGGLALNTLGLSAYTWIGQKYYVEAGAYTSPAAGTLNWLGADPLSPGNIHGLAPYGRIAWQGRLAGGSMELGAFALKARIYPQRDNSASLTDHYTDVGVDASWQKPTGAGNVIAVQARYIHESSDLQASCELGLIGPGGDPACAKTHLNELRGDVSYSWHNKIGATVGAFSITGDSNSNLFGGPNASPDSNGVMAQVDYTPWGAGNSPLGQRVNVRVGVQYTAYGKFDGAGQNYDGAGANASDNNAVRVFTWIAF
ncbi:MAG: hypothetical protein KGM49_02140 [Sphingomonadales bacterium]|nr:hypothetical protein [Sphingomonadales bacterium]